MNVTCPDANVAVKPPDTCEIQPVHEIVRVPVDCVVTVSVVLPLMFP